MKAPVFDISGTSKGDIILPKEIFGADVVPGLMHEALLRQQGNARIATAAVKTRSEVRGGGRKPWRQKGTGRARQGSIRSAQWTGGGVIFGPTTERNFSKNMPKKMRRKALFSALSAKAKEGKILALDTFSEKSPKTKVFADFLQKVECNGKTLVVLSERNEVLEKSLRNIPGVKAIFAQYLNVSDALSSKNILFVGNAVEKTQAVFAPKS